MHIEPKLRELIETVLLDMSYLKDKQENYFGGNSCFVLVTKRKEGELVVTQFLSAGSSVTADEFTSQFLIKIRGLLDQHDLSPQVITLEELVLVE